MSKETNQHDTTMQNILRTALNDACSFYARPTAFIPSGKARHPLEYQCTLLQAKLTAFQSIRAKLCFNSDRSIKTQVVAGAISSALNEVVGGIPSLNGFEPLCFAFLEVHELVTMSCVCKSWYYYAHHDNVWEPRLFSPMEDYSIRHILGIPRLKIPNEEIPAIQVYRIYYKVIQQMRHVESKEDEVDTLEIEDEHSTSSLNQGLYVWRRRPYTYKQTKLKSQFQWHQHSLHLITYPWEPLVLDLSHNDTSHSCTSASSTSIQNMLDTSIRSALHQWVITHEISPPQETRHINVRNRIPFASHNERQVDVDTIPHHVTQCMSNRRRLGEWVRKHSPISESMLCVMISQLLMAIHTLEQSGYIHQGISMESIQVLNIEDEIVPWFQLVCRRSVDTWFIDMDGYHVSTQEQSMVIPQPFRPLHGFIPLIHVRPDLEEDLETRDECTQTRRLPLVPRLSLVWTGTHETTRNNMDISSQRVVELTLHPLKQCMIQSLVSVVFQVWLHGRAHHTQNTTLSSLHTHTAYFSNGLRSWLEYAECLLLEKRATASQLLHHAYLHKPKGRFTMTLSTLNPQQYSSIQEYQKAVNTWYTHASPSISKTDQLPPQDVALSWQPKTTLGSLCLDNALLLNARPFQHFSSVVAPSTATTEWIRVLVESQRHCLKLLDLSHLKLPLSKVLDELSSLVCLEQLCLPREWMRDNNLEQWVLRVYCRNLFPHLKRMDCRMEQAMKHMEQTYQMQLDMVRYMLEMTRERNVAASY